MKRLPWNHFSRKNIGYLYAMREGANSILDMDDDNEIKDPVLYNEWFDNAKSSLVLNHHGPTNVYRYFENDCSTQNHIWPRGLPLLSVNEPKENLCDKDKMNLLG